MPSLSSDGMTSSTVTGVEVPDPRSLSAKALEEINTSTLLYCLLRACFSEGMASHSDICELIKLMPENLHDDFVTGAGSSDFYLHLLPPGLQISTPAVIEALITMFSVGCPFFTQYPCNEIVLWARENISNSGSTQRRFKIALHGVVDNSAAGVLAAAIGIQKTPLASKTSVMQEVGNDKNTPLQTAASRSSEIINRVSSATVSALKKIGGMFFFTSLSGDKFVSGELDARFRGSLLSILQQTELRLTDVLILFGISTESKNANGAAAAPAQAESIIPVRLWNLGYTLSIHGLLPEEKCSFATLKTFFPSMRFQTLAEEQLRYNGTHIYDTILENSQLLSELKWLTLNDLHYSLEVHECDQLMATMRDWRDFINVSLATRPPLSYSVWADMFGYDSLNPRFVFEFGYATKMEARVEFVNALCANPLLWPRDKAEKLAHLINSVKKADMGVKGVLKQVSVRPAVNVQSKPPQPRLESSTSSANAEIARILRSKMNL